MWGAAWAPSTNTGIPRACARATTSRTGLMVPRELETCTRATIFVRSVPPRGEQPLLARPQVGPAEARGHPVDPLRRAADEDDSARLAGVEERPPLPAGNHLRPRHDGGDQLGGLELRTDQPGAGRR